MSCPSTLRLIISEPNMKHKIVEISQDTDGTIFLKQDCGEDIEIILCSPKQALKLAHRLMSFAAGQGPREVEYIADLKS